ncbi:MAG: hypothetical protein DCC75_01175, partial [Proteobacteria bacterium]
NFNEDLKIKYVAAAEDFDRMRKIRGELYFHSKGFEAPLSVTDAELSVAVILNIAALIVISLWLALKAHRKVLDYFARSGALLPMVSATGKGPFYGAIWILTMLRVGAFLIATVPMMVYGLGELIDKNHFANLIGVNSWVFATWLLAITAGLALATLVASIADLRHRQSFFSFSYRYVPLFICASGALVWTATFIFDSRLSDLLRRIVTALPVAGMGPIMVAPIFRPGWDILIINAMLTGVTLIILLRVNARWFAAHLEEI